LAKVLGPEDLALEAGSSSNRAIQNEGYHAQMLHGAGIFTYIYPTNDQNDPVL